MNWLSAVRAIQGGLGDKNFQIEIVENDERYKIIQISVFCLKFENCLLFFCSTILLMKKKGLNV